jgi:cobalamin-dependent methionine synthase I
MAARKPILNSISLEASRLEPLLEIAADFECMVIALLMGPGGPPCGVDDRLENAAQLVERITAAGKALDEIIIDPCFLPISADPGAGPAVMQAIAAIRKRWPDIHVGGGLSNISYGLPKRRLVNLTALAQAIGRGMDAAILDPCTEGIMGTIYAAEALAGADEMCMGYVLASREGKLH